MFVFIFVCRTDSPVSLQHDPRSADLQGALTQQGPPGMDVCHSTSSSSLSSSSSSSSSSLCFSSSPSPTARIQFQRDVEESCRTWFYISTEVIITRGRGIEPPSSRPDSCFDYVVVRRSGAGGRPAELSSLSREHLVPSS